MDLISVTTTIMLSITTPLINDLLLFGQVKEAELLAQETRKAVNLCKKKVDTCFPNLVNLEKNIQKTYNTLPTI